MIETKIMNEDPIVIQQVFPKLYNSNKRFKDVTISQKVQFQRFLLLI
jgi:hypothetical protein